MNAPGVVIEEKGVPNVTVRKSPTVPVFIGFFHKNGARLPFNTGCKRISDLIELRNEFPNVLNITVAVDAGKTSATVTKMGYEHGSAIFSIAHYFENGGGPCYLLPVNSGNDKGLEAHIRKHPGISLVTVVEGTTGADNYYADLQPLINGPDGYFLIRHIQDVNATPGVSAFGMQTAVYHPFLHLDTTPWRDDREIPVTGLAGTTNLAELNSAEPALYAKADSAIKDLLKSFGDSAVPPCAAVAAAYCKTDRERGVWKAPANVVLNNARPWKIVSEADHGVLNTQGVNAIRQINKQTTIYGARTGELNDKQWRYVPVRRLVNQVQRDVAAALRALVFEPNTGTTWARARGAIESYLYNIWQLGGLQGSKPEQGYRVTIDNTIMTQADIDAGKMIARIELAPVKPAEFIVLQFSQDLT